MEPHSLEHPSSRGVTFFLPNETITPVSTTFGFSEFLSNPISVMDIDHLHLKGRAPLDADAKELSVLGHRTGSKDARIIRTDEIEIADVITPGVGDTLYRLSLFLPNYTGEHAMTVRAFHPEGPYGYEAHLKSLVVDEEEIEGNEAREVFHGMTETWNVIDPKTHHIIAENVDLFAEPDAEALSKLHFTFSQ